MMSIVRNESIDKTALLRTPIEDADLPTRVINHLVYEGIKTIGALVDLRAEDLRRWRGFGATSLRDVRRMLERHGLALRDDERQQ